MEGLKIRLFIALNIPDELREVLRGVQSRLKPCPGSISMVRPANIHITLKFMGHTEEQRLSPLIEALYTVSASTRPFELHSGGLGAFPSMKSPRGLWVGMDESKELRALKEAMEGALLPAGFEKDKKAFRPHLTLCRIRSKAAVKAMAAKAGPMKVEKKVAFIVDRFVLYKSILNPSGARYEVIREFPFGEKGA